MNKNVQLVDLVANGEEILWQGKPSKKTTILEAVFSPMCFFAILWAVIDFGFIINLAVNFDSGMPWYFIIPFFCIHLMPVWIYIGGIIKAVRIANNTQYVLTNKAFYSLETIGKTHFHKTLLEDMSDLHTSQGFIDKRIGVGDVVFDLAGLRNPISRKIENLDEFYELYEVIYALKKENIEYEDYAIALTRLQSFHKTSYKYSENKSNPLDH